MRRRQIDNLVNTLNSRKIPNISSLPLVIAGYDISCIKWLANECWVFGVCWSYEDSGLYYIVAGHAFVAAMKALYDDNRYHLAVNEWWNDQTQRLWYTAICIAIHLYFHSFKPKYTDPWNVFTKHVYGEPTNQDRGC